MTAALDGAVAFYGRSGNPSEALPTLTCGSAGNPIFVATRTNAASISSISDTGGGGTWLQRTFISDGSNNTLDLWWTTCAGTFNGVITINFSGGPLYTTAHAFAFSGCDIASVFDANGSLPDKAQGVGTADPRVVSTLNGTDVILGIFGMFSQLNPTAGSGFTQILGNTGSGALLTEYKIVSTAQTSLSVPIGTGSGDGYWGIADAIRQAGGGGGGGGKAYPYYEQMRRAA